MAAKRSPKEPGEAPGRKRAARKRAAPKAPPLRPAAAKPAPSTSAPSRPAASKPSASKPSASKPSPPKSARAQPAAPEAAPPASARRERLPPKGAAKKAPKTAGGRAPEKPDKPEKPRTPRKPGTKDVPAKRPAAAKQPAPVAERPARALDSTGSPDASATAKPGRAPSPLPERVPATLGALLGLDVEPQPTPRKRRPGPRPVAPMRPRRADGTITVAISPDADDAFMLYALEAGKVEVEDRRYEVVRGEIQALNEKAEEGVHDVTALSFGALPFLQDRYELMSCGASFGDARGPVLVARTPIRTQEVNGLTVAVPGLRTTAVLALRLWLPRAELDLVPVPFDQVALMVRAGRTRAGILIHEHQLIWQTMGLVRVVDFGQWWAERTDGLPLPLGATAIRRDIPEAERDKIALDLKRSIAYALGHREEALEHAARYAKGLPAPMVEAYVSRYVNEMSLEYGERGRQAIGAFYREAHRHGFLPEAVDEEAF